MKHPPVDYSEGTYRLEHCRVNAPLLWLNHQQTANPLSMQMQVFDPETKSVTEELDFRVDLEATVPLHLVRWSHHPDIAVAVGYVEGAEAEMLQKATQLLEAEFRRLNVVCPARCFGHVIEIPLTTPNP